MLWQILLAILLGTASGIFTGLVPGVHVNLIALSLVTLAPLLLRFIAPIYLGAYIIAMGITHTFLDIIPAVYLGAPSADVALIALPAHRLLQQGRGYEAVRLATAGGIYSIIGLIIISPLVYFTISRLYHFIESVMGWLLLAFLVILVLRNRDWVKRTRALVIILLSGTLGLVVLNTPLFKQPLFPMLTGLFGVSLLLHSLLTSTLLPSQGIAVSPVGKLLLCKAVLGALVGGVITGVFPGIGAAQAAIIGRGVIKRLSNRGFIVLNGGVNTVNFFVSLFTLHIVGKARNGAIMSLKQFLPDFGLGTLLFFGVVCMLAGGLAALVCLYLGRVIGRVINAIDYHGVSVAVILLLILLTIGFSGWLGLVVLMTGTAIGMLAHYTHVGKSNCMGCILLPVVVYFLM